MNTPTPLLLVRICDDSGAVLRADCLAQAEHVHRQLRPHLPYDYSGKMCKIFASGARMVLASNGSQALGLAVWRIFENTADNTKLHVDDLIIDEAHRRQGIGQALIAFLEEEARRQGAQVLGLDSGTQRTLAHRFYFREGFVITSFNFKKQLV